MIIVLSLITLAKTIQRQIILTFQTLGTVT